MNYYKDPYETTRMTHGKSKKVFLSWLSWCSSRTDGTDLVYTTGSTGLSLGNSDREYFVPSISRGVVQMSPPPSITSRGPGFKKKQ